MSIVVATFGDQSWRQLAAERAIPSAESFGVPFHVVHGDTLAQARNEGVARCSTEWVVHLDADDELAPGYLDELAKGTADLRAPAVSYNGRIPYVPKVAGHAHDCTAECLEHGNYLVVGALARVEQIKAVGGWEGWPVYEDWALWLRMWRAGATVESIPDAVYLAYARHDSRNRGTPMAVRNATHAAIHAANSGLADAA
ncbi:MAG: glycosyltransferase [Patulibacter minatonensis]